jgi:dolichol-phosphate mannosyltransferase
MPDTAHPGDLPLVTVVAPVYNEEHGLLDFYSRTTAALAAITPAVRHELLFVDDGSADASGDVLRKLAETDRQVRVISLSRNFGHQIAITAGLDEAGGDAVVVIDSDLQDPPEVIADMVAAWRGGSRVVYGVRTQRAGESGFKLVSAKLFYRLLNRLSDTPLPLDAGDFRLLDHEVVDVLRTLREENRYMRGMVSWVGFRQTAVHYARDERRVGETKYPLSKMLRLGADAVTSFSERPLRVALQLGALMTLVTFVLAGSIAVSKLLNPDQSISGYASLMVVVLFLGGLQLFTVGLLGEYVGRTYRETKRRPLYVVGERIGSSPPD